MLLSLSLVNWPVSQNYHNSLWFYRWYNNKQLRLMLCHYIYTVILVFTWERKSLSHNNSVLFWTWWPTLSSYPKNLWQLLTIPRHRLKVFVYSLRLNFIAHNDWTIVINFSLSRQVHEVSLRKCTTLNAILAPLNTSLNLHLLQCLHTFPHWFSFISSSCFWTF